jgi:hypothetical protein
MYHNMLPWMVKIQQDMRFREAEQARRVKFVRAAQPWLRRCIRVRVGSFLVHAGLSLLEQSEPALLPRCEATPASPGKAPV